MERNETWQSDNQRPRHKAVVNMPASEGLGGGWQDWNREDAREILETCL